jgi:hypothetical protein
MPSYKVNIDQRPRSMESMIDNAINPIVLSLVFLECISSSQRFWHVTYLVNRHCAGLSIGKELHDNSNEVHH